MKYHAGQPERTCIFFTCLRGQNLHCVTRGLEQELFWVIPVSLHLNVDVCSTVKVQAMAEEKIALKTFFFS